MIKGRKIDMETEVLQIVLRGKGEVIKKAYSRLMTFLDKLDTTKKNSREGIRVMVVDLGKDDKSVEDLETTTNKKEINENEF